MQDSSKDNTQYDATHYDPPRYDPPPQDTPQPGTPQPGTPQPGTPQPGSAQQSTPQPGTPQPGTPQPGSAQQSTPQPGIPQPGSAQPGTPQQSTPQPGTPQASASRQANQNAPQYNPYYNPPPQRRRPIGVTILSILIGIEGLIALFIGILAIVALSALGRQFGTHGHGGLNATFVTIGWILGILPLVLGAIILAVAVGLFLLKSWAFWTTVVVSVIFLLRQIYQFFQPHESYTLIIIGTIISAVVLLYLLLDPNVRRAFHIGGAGREGLV